MKNQALFSSKDKSKNLKCRLLQFLLCVLRVNDRLAYLNIHSYPWCCFLPYRPGGENSSIRF